MKRAASCDSRTDEAYRWSDRFSLGERWDHSRWWQKHEGWSEWSGSSKQQEVKKEQEVIIYLDYNGVLNRWPNEDSVKRFLEGLKLLARKVKIRLISFAGGRDRVEQTMFEIVHSGIHTQLDSIVFTKYRTSAERRRSLEDKWSTTMPQRRVKEFRPFPECRIAETDGKPYNQIQFAQWVIDNAKQSSTTYKKITESWSESKIWKVQYVRYYGGKDEYVQEQYGKEYNQKTQRVVFVDDNAANVLCVKQLAHGKQGSLDVPVTAFRHRREPHTYEHLSRELQKYIQDDR